jgi:hypothetical protein
VLAIPDPDEVAAILMLAPRGQPYSHEGPARARVRSMLCLAGEPWRSADRTAAELVLRARGIARIETPDGWDHNDLEALAPDWGACVVCGTPFRRRGADRRYCSRRCIDWAYAIRKAGNGAGPNAHRNQTCAHCGSPFEPVNPQAEYCSPACRVAVAMAVRRANGPQPNLRWRAEKAARAEAEAAHPRRCRLCNGPIEAGAHGLRTRCGACRAGRQ